MATYIPPNTPVAGEEIARGFQMFMTGLEHRQQRARDIFNMGYKLHNKGMLQSSTKMAGYGPGAYPEEAKTKLANMIVKNTDAADRKANEQSISRLGKFVTNTISGVKSGLKYMTESMPVGPERKQESTVPVDLSQMPTDQPGAGPNYPPQMGYQYQTPMTGERVVRGPGRDVRKSSMESWENYPEDTNVTRIAVEGKVKNEDADKLAKEYVRYAGKIKQDPSYAGRIAKALNISPEAIPVAFQKIQQPAPPEVGSSNKPQYSPQAESIPSLDDIYNESKQGGEGRLADGLNILRRRFSEEIQRNPKAAMDKAMDYIALEDQLHTYYGDDSQSNIIANLAKNIGRKLPSGAGGGRGKKEYWLNEVTGQRVDAPPKNPDGTYVKGWRLMTPAVEQRYGEDLRRIVDSEDVSDDIKNQALRKLASLEGGPEGAYKYAVEDIATSASELENITKKYAGTPFANVFAGLAPEVDTRVAQNTGFMTPKVGDTIAYDDEKKQYRIIRGGKDVGEVSKEVAEKYRKNKK